MFKCIHHWLSHRIMEVRIGCSGWSYKGWVGPFYPRGTKPGQFLELYSRVFNTVEIDSTFYATPGVETVRKWKEKTPDDFLFTAKMPKIITHERMLSNVDIHLGYFIEAMEKLEGKLGMILVQFPHGFTYQDGSERLVRFLKMLPGNIHFAIEFRHDSWFNEDTYSALSEHDVTLAWSEVPMTASSTARTTSSAYVRLVGDRTIEEKDFGTVQRDRSDVIEKWASLLKERKDIIDHTFVFSNNHFQGFGPGTVNLFRKAMEMDEVNWSRTMVPEKDQGQKSLLDW